MVWRGMMEAKLKGWMLVLLNLGTFTVLGTLGGNQNRLHHEVQEPQSGGLYCHAQGNSHG